MKTMILAVSHSIDAKYVKVRCSITGNLVCLSDEKMAHVAILFQSLEIFR